MRTRVVYDSVFGNTEKIAQAIAEGMGSTALAVSGLMSDTLQGLDILVVGSPTRGFRPTPAVAKFLRQLAINQLAGIAVAAFDTRAALESIDSGFVRFIVHRGGYAAPTIARLLQKAGGMLLAPPEGFFVTDTEGPLKDGELERAAIWGSQLIRSRQPEPISQ